MQAAEVKKVVPEILEAVDQALGDDVYTVNECTGEVYPIAEPKFDYYKFEEYQHLHSLLQQVQRLIMKKSSGTGCGSKKEPSEVYLKRNFAKIYGPVDFTSAEVKNQLDAMKETLMEYMAVEVFDEIRERLLDIGISDSDPARCEQELRTQINEKFTGEEQLTYSSFNPKVAEGEWFVLARRDLKTIREECFPELTEDDDEGDRLSSQGSESFESSGSDAEATVGRRGNGDHCGEEGTSHRIAEDVEYRPMFSESAVKLRLSNLHVYDPMFEYSFKPPYRIIRKGNDDEPDVIPTMVAFRVLEHLNRFPYGVTSADFWSTFYEQNGFIPRLAGLGNLNAILQHLDKEIGFVKLSDDFPSLIFPRYLQGVFDPDVVFKRVWHCIRCLLVLKHFIRSDEVLPLLKTVYNMDFNPGHWNFSTVHKFLSYCVNRFVCQEKVALYRQVVMDDHVNYTFDYLMIKSAAVERRVEKLHGPKRQKKIEKPVNAEKLAPMILPPAIPPKYLNLFDSIPAVSNSFSVDDIIIANVDWVNSPWNMFVGQRQLSFSRIRFQHHIQTDRIVFETTLCTPDPKTLLPGLYVLAYIEYQSTKSEWYRARIVNRSKDMQTYCVYAIDWGFEKIVSVSTIRYMPREKISKVAAYGIPVKLKVAHPFRRGKKAKWETSCRRILLKCVKPNYVNATLLSSRFSHTFGCLKWTVLCSVINVETKVRIHRSLTEVFYIAFKKELCDERERRKAYKMKTVSISEEAENTGHGPVEKTNPAGGNTSKPEKTEDSMVRGLEEIT